VHNELQNSLAQSIFAFKSIPNQKGFHWSTAIPRAAASAEVYLTAMCGLKTNQRHKVLCSLRTFYQFFQHVLGFRFAWLRMRQPSFYSFMQLLIIIPTGQQNNRVKNLCIKRLVCRRRS